MLWKRWARVLLNAKQPGNNPEAALHCPERDTILVLQKHRAEVQIIYFRIMGT